MKISVSAIVMRVLHSLSREAVLLLPEGAGAPLLLPRPRRRERGRGGQGEKSEGDHPPEGEAEGATHDPRMRIRVDPARSAGRKAQAEEGRGDRFSPCWGEGAALPFPSKRTMSVQSEGSAAAGASSRTA
ncbi:MAG: hypothetical protein EOR35_31365 [Mesorhizobium sp.]|nr:MAG: hypothetical protein EOR35_31365 [Mesorhizobium sp.]